MKLPYVMKSKLLSIATAALFCGSTFFGNGFQEISDTMLVKDEMSNQWKKFHSVGGKCCVDLPEAPEHIKQNLAMPDEEYTMQYDVYVSGMDNKAVFMMLIAQYPPFVDESFAEMSLESFLNGILSQNPSNQLVFADLVEVQGHKAMDFFIRTNNVYFKGRAVMAKNNLYLIAMECETKNYKEQDFTHFINSFEILE